MTYVVRLSVRKPVNFADCIFHCGPENQEFLHARVSVEAGSFKYANVYAPGMLWFYSAIREEADLHNLMLENEDPFEWYWMDIQAIPTGARITNIHFNPWGEVECALNDLIHFLEESRVQSIDELTREGMDALWSNSPMVEVLLGNYELITRWEERIWARIGTPDAAALFDDIIDPSSHTIYDVLNDLTVLSRPRSLSDEQMTRLVPLLQRYAFGEIEKIYGDPTYRAWFNGMDELRTLKRQFDLETGTYADVLNSALFQQLIEETKRKDTYEVLFDQGTYTMVRQGLRITQDNLRQHARYRTLDKLQELYEQSKAIWLQQKTVPFSERTLAFFCRLGLAAYLLIPEPIHVSPIRKDP